MGSPDSLLTGRRAISGPWRVPQTPQRWVECRTGLFRSGSSWEIITWVGPGAWSPVLSRSDLCHGDPSLDGLAVLFCSFLHMGSYPSRQRGSFWALLSGLEFGAGGSAESPGLPTAPSAVSWPGCCVWSGTWGGASKPGSSSFVLFQSGLNLVGYADHRQ